MQELAWYKKVIGYIYPITVQKQANSKHSKLRIKYYQGQYQLESGGALYSDGYRYSPFRLGYAYLQKQKTLQKTKTFLLLGSGLGSALIRLQKVYNLYPETTLVEYDADIIEFSKIYLLNNQQNNIQFIKQDAQDYLSKTSEKFDLIGIDLFKDLENSVLINQTNFWSEIKNRSTSKTNIILNTIFMEKSIRNDFEKLLAKDFTFHRLDQKPNYIYMLKVKT